MNKDEQNKIMKQIDEVDWEKIKSIFNAQWGVTSHDLEMRFDGLPKIDDALKAETKELFKSLCWVYFTVGLRTGLIYVNGIGKTLNGWADGIREQIESDPLSRDFEEEITQ